MKDIFDQASAWVGHDHLLRVIETALLLALYFALRLTIRRTANSLIKQPERQFQYLCEPRRRRSTESQLWKAIFEEFARSDSFRFAYPTQRLLLDPNQLDLATPRDLTTTSVPAPTDKN